ncbi:MAG: hypothetical protein LBC85_02390 [Fibromonadaceae bacterium]|jgi:hypothetical protein|nr:hypothetical protein [Fibromonadaceae bacterium]
MKKAHFYVDGFSFKRINDYYRYEHKRRSRLNIAAFETYLRYEIARKLGISSDSESLSFEKHFYYPSPNPRTCFYKSSVTDTILNFENCLAEAGYIVHYSRKISTLEPRPNENLFADSLVATQLKKIDLFILLSTQGQHANILQQMRHCKIPNILVGWEAICRNSRGAFSKWKTDRILCGFANAYSPLERILDLPSGKHPLTETMFENFFSLYRPPAFSPSYPLNLRCG